MRFPLCSVLALLAVLVSNAAPTADAAAGRIAVKGLRCEYEVDPIGIDVSRPRLGWVIDSSRRGEAQTAYQVLVAGSPEALRVSQGDLWDSGKVVSDESAHVVYSGRELASGQRAWWKVRTWDRDGRPSEYGRPAFWEMGLLRQEDWKARWIGFAGEPVRRHPLSDSYWIWHAGDGAAPPAGSRYFRLKIDIPEGTHLHGAHFLLAADDGMTLYVNGQEAGKHAGWEQVADLDVQRFLKTGPNVLAIRATNATGPAGVIGRLIVVLDEGARVVVTTDKAWKSSAEGPAGWQTEAFDDRGWTPAAQVQTYGGDPWKTLQLPPVPNPHLRKSFEVTRRVRQARVYATALGLYELRLNGTRVGQDLFTPGWTDYRKRLHYQTYDVTRILRRGPNALGMILGDGWYCGYVGLGGRNRYGRQPLGLCQLRIDYTDGGQETIVSDGSWKASSGPLLSSDLLMGETYDARRELSGWDRAGFNDADWSPAQVQQPEVRLEAQKGPPARRQEELPARELTQPAAGKWVFDLGQNMVGWARLRVRGAAGTTVTLRFAEMLNPDGTIYTTNYRGARCTDQYTLKGGREEVYEPRFTFRGFRYVEVTGYPGTPSAGAITGVVVHSDTPASGAFTCSSPMVNQLQSNIRWGQRGNFLAVPTDCPQRDERLGWTGDAQIFVRTATFNMDVAGFFTKWLVDLDDAQTPDGAYPDVAPRVAAGAGTAAWGDAGVICPWTIYLAYGDRRILEEHYPAMVRWVEYCRAHSRNLLRPAQGYGDWLNIRDETPKDVLATAYFAYSTRLVARSAAAIGKTEDARKYEDLFQQIRTQFNQAYVAPDGRVKGNTQTGYVVALRFDLLPEELREKAAGYLAERIRERSVHLSTGFVGVGYLLPTLTRAGYTDVAYRLLNNDTFPSWGYTIKHGATTIWERWDGWTEEKGFQDPGMNSFNHYSLGSVGEWLYDTVAGIGPDPDRPGYKHIVLRPRPGGGLTYARGEYQSIYGRIASDWQLRNGQLSWTVTVPANTMATVYVPAAEGAAVRESGRPAERAPGVTASRRAPGASVYEVGSGTYRFTVPFAEGSSSR